MEKGTVQLTFESGDEHEVKLFVQIVELFAQKVFKGAKVTQVIWPVIDREESNV